jgi:hypothetical protein
MGIGGSALRATTTAAGVEVLNLPEPTDITSKSLWDVAHNHFGGSHRRTAGLGLTRFAGHPDYAA